MNDPVFRGKQEPSTDIHEDKPMAKSSGDPVGDLKVEPPYTDYETAHHFPFIVDYYELGQYWNMDDAYTKEVDTIENYLRGRIGRGEVSNSLEAIKEVIKGIEKTAGVLKTDPTVVRVGKVAAYTKFLSEVDGLNTNARKYGSSR